MLEICYEYDYTGNRISRIKDGNKEIYRYNNRNQLIGRTRGDEHITYSYDYAGNLVEERFLYAGTENITRESYSCTTGDSHSTRYIYDSYNRNTEVLGNDFYQKNAYDAKGYRYSLEENGQVTNFIYKNGMLLSEIHGEEQLEQTYVLGNEYIGSVKENGKNVYYITDEQGSLRYVLNNRNEVESYYQYDAFGETISQEGSRSRLQYNSQVWDELSGLYYLRISSITDIISLSNRQRKKILFLKPQRKNVDERKKEKSLHL